MITIAERDQLRHQRLREKLMQQRIAASFSMHDAAKLIGKSYNTYRDIEKGNKDPSPQEAQILIRSFDLPADYFAK